MRRDNLRRVQIESSNRETQPASEIGVGLAQRNTSKNPRDMDPLRVICGEFQF